MTQSRTHNCNELRIENVGEKVTIVGWYDNMRKVFLRSDPGSYRNGRDDGGSVRSK